MTADGPDDTLPSTPWERAARPESPDPEPDIDAEADGDTGPVTVADLMARLGIGQDREPETTDRRRRRRAEAEESAAVSAAAIIASLGGPDDPATHDGPAGSEPVPPTAPAESLVSPLPAESLAWSEAASLAEPEAPASSAAAPPSGEGPPPAGGVISGDEPPSHADGPGRGWLMAGRSLVAVVAILLLIAAGTEWVIKARADATLASNTVDAIDTADPNISPPPPLTNADATADAPTAAPQRYEAENVLMIGTDSRIAAEDAALGGHDDSPGGSDVVMVAHLAADRSHETIVSIPRDTYIKAPTCKAWDHVNGVALDQDYTTPYSLWRINSTYAAGGPPCTVKAVQELTGLRIDRVIIIDFSGFRSIVDALGGIEVNVCAPIVDTNLGTVVPRAGKQHINGKQALRLVRARHVVGDPTSDLGRIKRQQKVLSTILRQVTSAGVLLNPLKLDAVLQAFVQNVKSDNVSMDSLLDLAQSLGNLEPKRVTFFTLPTVPDSNGVGLHPAENSDLIWKALRADTALPGEITSPPTTSSTTKSTPMTTITPDPVTSLVTGTATTTPQIAQVVTVAPRDVDLQVVNVAGRGGVATAAMEALIPLGYRLTGPDLLLVTDDTRSGITVEFAPDNREAALTVAATVPGSTLAPVAGLGSKVRLMLGSSFDGDVRAVAVGDPLPSRLSDSPAAETYETVTTIVSTPPAIVTPAPSTTRTTASTLEDLELTSVNAGDKGCI